MVGWVKNIIPWTVLILVFWIAKHPEQFENPVLKPIFLLALTTAIVLSVAWRVVWLHAILIRLPRWLRDTFLR